MGSLEELAPQAQARPPNPSVSSSPKSRQEGGSTSSPPPLQTGARLSSTKGPFHLQSLTLQHLQSASLPGCQWVQLGAASSPEFISPLASSLTSWDGQVGGHSIPEASPRLLFCMLEERGKEKYRGEMAAKCSSQVKAPAQCKDAL